MIHKASKNKNYTLVNKLQSASLCSRATKFLAIGLIMQSDIAKKTA